MLRTYMIYEISKVFSFAYISILPSHGYLKLLDPHGRIGNSSYKNQADTF